jgi:hypothetical protein
MKKNTKSLMCCLAFTGITFFSTSCGFKESEEASNQVAESQFDRIRVLNAKPEGALPVKAAREKLKLGESAVVVGQIGGSLEPFLEGYAGFVLADTDIEFCDEMGDDHCSTPWDACCEDPDKVKASRASVQFVDADGEPLAVSVEGFSGLKGLSHVVVTGTVAGTSTPENLIIDADGIYIVE